MKSKLIVLGILVFMLQSCALQSGRLYFEKQPNKMMTSQSLKDFFKEHPNPTILLRVPQSKDYRNDEAYQSFIYNSIEKELVHNGFVVKDRDLYDALIYQSRNLGLEEINKAFATDLIIEVIHYEDQIVYSSNTIIDKYGYNKHFDDYTVTRKGASLTIKISLLDNYEFAGTYTFDYTPCHNNEVNQDCNCAVGYKPSPRKMYPRINMCDSKDDPQLAEIELHLLDEFIAESIKSMMQEVMEE